MVSFFAAGRLRAMTPWRFQGWLSRVDRAKEEMAGRGCGQKGEEAAAALERAFQWHLAQLGQRIFLFRPRALEVR